MHLASDMEALAADISGPAQTAEVRAGEVVFSARVVLSRAAQGGVRAAFGWDADTPRGADWATAIVPASQLPDGVDIDDVESLNNGILWRVDGHTAITDRDAAGAAVVVGWRLALRGTQRGVR